MNLCPECGKKTVTENSPRIMPNSPPRRRRREWCGCGWRGEWVTYTKIPEEWLADKWKRLNEIEE